MIIPTLPLGKVVDDNGLLTPEFYNFFMQLVQLMNQNLGEKGVVVQNQSSSNIGLFNLENGTIVYDSTINQFKGYENGTLKTFTLT